LQCLQPSKAPPQQFAQMRPVMSRKFGLTGNLAEPMHKKSRRVLWNPAAYL
jgi:hypothetical protein